MNVIIPMAGESKIFKDAGFRYNKNFTEIAHKPLFQRVFEGVKNIQADNFIFVVTKDDARKYHIGKSLKLLSPKCYVAPVYNMLIDDGKKIGFYNIGSLDAGMYGLGVPDDLNKFLANPISRKILEDN